MSIEMQKLDEANETLNTRMGYGIFAVVVSIGIYVFFVYGLAYLEVKSLPYMGLYVMICALLYFSKKNIAKTALLLVLAILIIAASVMRVSWQKDYYESDEPFMFLAHIDDYPSWEGRMVSRLSGAPDWVGFAKDCGKTAQNGEPFRDSCRTFNNIQRHYNIDMQAELDEYIARMRHTVSLVERRGSLTAAQYTGCVKKMECAEIPTLPPGVEPDMVDPDNTQHVRVAKAYWDLAENKELSPEVCSFITLCKVLNTTGAITFE